MIILVSHTSKEIGVKLSTNHNLCPTKVNLSIFMKPFHLISPTVSFENEKKCQLKSVLANDLEMTSKLGM